MTSTAGSTAAAARPGSRAGLPALLSFLRFVVCGGGVTLLSSAALLLIGDRVPLALANAVLTVASTVLATELHGRFTFGRGRASWRDHWASGLTVLMSYLITTCALTAYDALHPGGNALLRQGAYLAASGLAGLARFLLLRHLVFAPGGARRRLAGHRADRRGWEPAGAVGQGRGLAARPRTELGEDVRDMELHRRLADVQSPRDLPVPAPQRQLVQNLALARVQGVERVLRRDRGHVRGPQGQRDGDRRAPARQRVHQQPAVDRGQPVGDPVRRKRLGLQPAGAVVAHHGA